MFLNICEIFFWNLYEGGDNRWHLHKSSSLFNYEVYEDFHFSNLFSRHQRKGNALALRASFLRTYAHKCNSANQLIKGKKGSSYIFLIYPLGFLFLFHIYFCYRWWKSGLVCFVKGLGVDECFEVMGFYSDISLFPDTFHLHFLIQRSVFDVKVLFPIF